MLTQTSSAARVKICGITSIADVQSAIDSGADAIGLVFYEPSPRCVAIEQAREIALAAGPFVTVVGLFVDADAAFVHRVLEHVPLHVLQFHGDENATFCESFQRPYLKAIRMQPELNLQAVMHDHPNATAFLLDAYRTGVPGGTGETFDWQRVPKDSARPIVLAGGLTPENIASAVNATQVYGVDVSGGVESAPGIKDPIKIRNFIHNAKIA